jgi:formylglycine-generating enzyme required for sulfatase activity
MVLDSLAVASPVCMEFVYVAAGEFLMGSTLTKGREASKAELPQHRICLAEFRIGKYPVTNAQYSAFVESARYEAPSYWHQEGIPADKGDRPLVQICCCDARALYTWLSEAIDRSFRLPTEAEWEKTARHGWAYLPMGRSTADG